MHTKKTRKKLHRTIAFLLHTEVVSAAKVPMFCAHDNQVTVRATDFFWDFRRNCVWTDV